GFIPMHKCRGFHPSILGKQVRTETLRKFKDYSVGRRNDPKNTPIIVVQQRTNVEDVSGYILRELAEDYTYLKLPVRSPIAIDINQRLLLRDNTWNHSLLVRCVRTVSCYQAG
ncbi:hypothetical protein, partial [Scytonema sp. PCC 10023]|uniref:hypothetical protein n=1 Tax=Scytonema sp. PCC 10023 TaxID=1680591 RepID=UPI0039C6EC7B